MNKNFQDDSGDKKYFTIIPNYIFDHGSPWDLVVYTQMKRIAGEHGTCWYSQSKLAKQCGMGVTRLRQSLNFLIENKLIEYIGEKIVLSGSGEQATKEYKIVDIWNKNMEYFKDRGVSLGDTPEAKVYREASRGCIASQAGGVSSDEHKEEHITNNPVKNIIVQKKTFERFWEEYPVKKNKLKSRELWFKKIKPELFERIIEDVIKRKEEDNQWSNKSYIPHPTTYLNGARWEDEITKQTNKSGANNIIRAPAGKYKNNNKIKIN